MLENIFLKSKGLKHRPTGRGVKKLDGARGKKHVWRPMFELEVFLEANALHSRKHL